MSDVAEGKHSYDEWSMKNVGAPVIQVKHKDLPRVDSSDYRSDCPVCSIGLLMVLRDHVTFKLEPFDRCSCCGQTFEYTDIEDMRTNLG